MNKLKRPNQPGPLTKQLAADIAKRYAMAEAAEQQQRKQAQSDIGSIAQDPIAALFTGVQFRSKADRPAIEQRVRTYCYKQIGDNWTAAQNELDAERSQLRLQIAILEEAIRTAKRNHASEIIEVTRGRVGSEAMGLAERRN